MPIIRVASPTDPIRRSTICSAEASAESPYSRTLRTVAPLRSAAKRIASCVA